MCDVVIIFVQWYVSEFALHAIFCADVKKGEKIEPLLALYCIS
jgi:hypothetical protein